MKKVFYLLALALGLVVFVGCTNTQSECNENAVDSTKSVVVDTLKPVIVDTTLKVNKPEEVKPVDKKAPEKK